MIFDKKEPTCPFNDHKLCVLSCMFAIGYEDSDDIIKWIGCKLKPKELSVSFDADGALIHIAETLDKVLDKL